MTRRGRRGSKSSNRLEERPARSTDHLRHLRNPVEPHRVLSDDEVAHIHAEASRFLQEEGIRILLPEARDLLAAAGAAIGVDGDPEMVRVPVEVIDDALSTVPSSFRIRGVDASRDHHVGGDSVAFVPVGGPPFVSDLRHGRRAGTLADLESFLRLTHSFDVLHANSPAVEPQDVSMTERHLQIVMAQLRYSDKVPFLYMRGRDRVHDCFALLKIFHGLDDDAFAEVACCWGNINTNSPRQIDVPMALGVIDMARAGQPCMMTPFTLAGAMAPVSLAGAVLLQHLEFLAAATLSQVVRPGAPIVYGGFTSNVDMRTGSPAFGTPEAMQGAIVTGQLARYLGIPWRSSASSSSTTEDAQGSYETLINLLGALQGGANIVLHSAGWQEGGLCASFEKFVLDVEVLQTIAESWQPVDVSEPELAYDTLAEVEPGSHFFGTQHTLDRFETAFYDPIVSTRQNYETWVEEGSKDARARAHEVWQRVLADYEAPSRDAAVMAELDELVARRIAEGGAGLD